MIAAAAANSNLKRVTLELGGKSPTVVLAESNCKCNWNPEFVFNLAYAGDWVLYTLKSGPRNELVPTFVPSPIKDPHI